MVAYSLTQEHFHYNKTNKKKTNIIIFVKRFISSNIFGKHGISLTDKNNSLNKGQK